MRSNALVGVNGETIQHHLVEFGNGATTCVYTARYDREEYFPSIEVFDAPTNLLEWSRTNKVLDAINGGFTVNHRSDIPTQHLGLHRSGSKTIHTVPFATPKSGLHVTCNKETKIVHADEVADFSDGDFLQAGPMIVRNGVIAEDFEGVDSPPLQFDDDITSGRFPRAAIGLTEESIITVSCDGYTSPLEKYGSKGLTLIELASFMIKLGIKEALNLDGGSKTTHIVNGRLINRPRGGKRDDYAWFPEGNAIMSAIAIRQK